VAVQTTWEVLHHCGHKETHDLSSRRVSERAGYARWLARKDCTECWRHSQHNASSAGLPERRAAELVEVESWENWTEMPPLEGSDRAVDWGRRIRYELLCSAWCALRLPGEAFRDRIEAPARAVRSASWWIDQRECEATDLEELLADAATSAASAASGRVS
jgi:hypothetical protein